MKHRILYAIHHKAAEDYITGKIEEQYEYAGAVTYREAILPKLREDRAIDTLLLRETLPGDMNMDALLCDIRVEFPHIRIIVICIERSVGDPTLRDFASLGIYDIINSDRPTLSEIISYILTPRTICDAIQYGLVVTDGDQQSSAASKPQSTENPRGAARVFSDLTEGIRLFLSSFRTDDMVEQAEVDTVSKQDGVLDADALRESIRVTEQRKAQENLDALIEKAVCDKTQAQQEENTALRDEISALREEIEGYRSRLRLAAENEDAAKSACDKLTLELRELQERRTQELEVYSTQLKAATDPTNTPEWYAEQSTAWKTEKETLQKQIEQMNETLQERESDIAHHESVIEQLRAEVKRMEKDTAESGRKGKQKPDSGAAPSAAWDAERKTLQGRISQMEDEAKQRDEKLLCSEAEARNLQTMLTEQKKRIAELECALRDESAKALCRTENEQAIREHPAMREPSGCNAVPPKEQMCAEPVADTRKAAVLPQPEVSGTGRKGRLLLSIGARRGIGNTTMALWFAERLAKSGYRTMLAELCPNGMALTATLTDEWHGAGHIGNRLCLSPDVRDALLGDAGPDQTLSDWLSRYDYVILDIRCDDYKLLSAIGRSEICMAGRLYLTVTQTGSAVGAAQALIADLSRAAGRDLTREICVFVNRFLSGASVSRAKLCQALHIRKSQTYCVMDTFARKGGKRQDTDPLRSAVIDLTQSA